MIDHLRGRRAVSVNFGLDLDLYVGAAYTRQELEALDFTGRELLFHRDTKGQITAWLFADEDAGKAGLYGAVIRRKNSIPSLNP